MTEHDRKLELDLFGSAPIDADSMPLYSQIKCVERELSRREELFRREVAHGFRTAAEAAHELAGMRAVHATLCRIAAGEP